MLSCRNLLIGIGAIAVVPVCVAVLAVERTLSGFIIWRFKTGNAVFSSPAVAQGVIYIGSCDGNVYALDAATGTKRWSFTTTALVAVLSAPTMANGVVYVGTNDDYVYALDARTGDERWSFATHRHVISSPIVANGLVYVGSTDGSMDAINA